MAFAPAGAARPDPKPSPAGAGFCFGPNLRHRGRRSTMHRDANHDDQARPALPPHRSAPRAPSHPL